MPAPEWRVLIADDEPVARRGVRQLLVPYPAFIVVAEARDGPETVKAIDQHRPDVVFLDIQMPGLDGFQVIQRYEPDRMPAVVFLTAYEEFALRGFEAQAFDYLVKPVTEARFAKTVERLSRLLTAAPAHADRGLVVSTARGMLRLELSEIDWIEAADNYARIWIGNRDFLLRESLQRLEERLDASGFCRAHRRALVRIGAIRRFARTESGGGVAVLRSGVMIPVSRRQKSVLLERVRAT
jgi:two-component system, LytTR family, response regulator